MSTIYTLTLNPIRPVAETSHRRLGVTWYAAHIEYLTVLILAQVTGVLENKHGK